MEKKRSGMKVPDYFNEEATEIFKENIELLDFIGVLRPEDYHLVEALAYYKAKWRECTRRIENESMVIAGQRGGDMVKNPLFTLQKQFYDSFMTAVRKLGIGPVERAKLEIEERTVEDDPTDPMKLE